MMLKLVGFDYVIARPDCPYLATKTEKLHYFQTTPGLDPSLFPARLYRAKHAFEDQGTLVDKFPIFLSGVQCAASCGHVLLRRR